MHIAEHCITNLKSLKAVTRLLKINKVTVSRESYKRIHCEMSNREVEESVWAFTGYQVIVDNKRVIVETK